MSDAVLAALISAFALIAVALIGVLAQNVKLGRRIDRVHDKAEVVRDQVQNSHGTNLRDDIDSLRTTVAEGFDRVERRQDVAARTAVSTRAEAQKASRAAAAVARRLDEYIDGTTD
jgi:hypothetical protein